LRAMGEQRIALKRPFHKAKKEKTQQERLV